MPPHPAGGLPSRRSDRGPSARETSHLFRVRLWDQREPEAEPGQGGGRIRNPAPAGAESTVTRRSESAGRTPQGPSGLQGSPRWALSLSSLCKDPHLGWLLSLPGLALPAFPRVTLWVHGGCGRADSIRARGVPLWLSHTGPCACARSPPFFQGSVWRPTYSRTCPEGAWTRSAPCWGPWCISSSLWKVSAVRFPACRFVWNGSSLRSLWARRLTLSDPRTLGQAPGRWVRSRPASMVARADRGTVPWVGCWGLGGRSHSSGGILCPMTP